jgi:two-component system NtrC family response regulator
LENEVKRLVASVRAKSITEANLDASIRASVTKVAAAPEAPSRSLPAAVEQLERRLIEEALGESKGNKQRAAQTLGLSRQGLIKKLKRLRIGP